MMLVGVRGPGVASVGRAHYKLDPDPLSEVEVRVVLRLAAVKLKVSRDEVSAVDTSLANTPKDSLLTGNANTPQTTKPGDEEQPTVTPAATNADAQQPTKPAKKPSIVFTVPQLGKKANQPDVRKPATPKFPRIGLSFKNPFSKPKPAEDSDVKPGAGTSDTSDSAGANTPAASGAK